MLRLYSFSEKESCSIEIMILHLNLIGEQYHLSDVKRSTLNKNYITDYKNGIIIYGIFVENQLENKKYITQKIA